MKKLALAGVAQLFWHCPVHRKAASSTPSQGHVQVRLCAQSPVGDMQKEGSQSTFCSYIDVFLSPLPSPLSKNRLLEKLARL